MTVPRGHVHVLSVPQGYDTMAAWLEQAVFGELLVPADTPCSRIVWWCWSPECPEGVPPVTSSTGPYDQDAST